MRTSRQRQATTVIVVLAVLLGSLWAVGLNPSATGDLTSQLNVTRPMPGIEAAVLPDRAPALRPSAERPDPAGRLLPLLLGLLAALAATFGLAARWLRSEGAAVRSLAWSSHREARAPPHLQPA
jgi:hypothetical protein